MNIESLPTKGRHYGSGEAITEFSRLIDDVMRYEAHRCDCDSSNRCRWCMLEQEIRTKRELLKKKIADFINLIEKERG